MYCVTVTFRIAAGKQAAFLALMLENAATSLGTEPGCQRFDVLTDPARPQEVFLYELYVDRAAFEHHLASPHFRVFDQTVAAMVADKQVKSYGEVWQ